MEEEGIARVAGDNSKVAVLSGGGIDSTLCLYQFKEKGTSARAVHIDYGQPSAALEWLAVQSAAARLAFPAEQIILRGSITFQTPEILGRNAALVFIAAMHLRESEKLLCLGIHAGTPFFDCSPPFFHAIEKLVAQQSDSRIRVVAPLLHFTKPEICRLAVLAGVPLSNTYSCQRGVPEGCGQCHSCKDRKAIGC